MVREEFAAVVWDILAISWLWKSKGAIGFRHAACTQFQAPYWLCWVGREVQTGSTTLTVFLFPHSTRVLAHHWRNSSNPFTPSVTVLLATLMISSRSSCGKKPRASGSRRGGTVCAEIIMMDGTSSWSAQLVTPNQQKPTRNKSTFLS